MTEDRSVIEVTQRDDGVWTAVVPSEAELDRRRWLLEEKGRRTAEVIGELGVENGRDFQIHHDEIVKEWRADQRRDSKTTFERTAQKYLDESRNRKWVKNRGGGAQRAFSVITTLHRSLDEVEIWYQAGVDALENPPTVGVEAMGDTRGLNVVDAKLTFPEKASYRGLSPEAKRIRKQNENRALIEKCIGPLPKLKGKRVLELFSGDRVDSLANTFEEAGAEYNGVDIVNRQEETRHLVTDAYKVVRDGTYRPESFDHIVINGPTIWEGVRDGDNLIRDPKAVVGLFVDSLKLLKTTSDSSLVVAADAGFSEMNLGQISGLLSNAFVVNGLRIEDWQFSKVGIIGGNFDIVIKRK